MRVMMLLKSDAPTEAGELPSEEMFTALGEYSETLVNAGVMRGGEGLQPSSRGAKIRIANGKTSVIDGPFAEAKELIAGYMLLETASLAEAIAWAKRLPTVCVVDEDHVELRPLYEPEELAADVPVPARQPAPLPTPEQGARWVSLLKADRNTEAGMKPSAELMQKMGALIQDMTAKGVLIAGEGLKPSAQSARVYITANGGAAPALRGGAASDKRVRVVDGPFAEAKELVAGFTLFRARSKAEAIEWARRCLQIHVDGTGIDHGEIEVRPILETDEIPVRPEETAGGWRDQERRVRERTGA
jgi:hypothetical protein